MVEIKVIHVKQYKPQPSNKEQLKFPKQYISKKGFSSSKSGFKSKDLKGVIRSFTVKDNLLIKGIHLLKSGNVFSELNKNNLYQIYFYHVFW